MGNPEKETLNEVIERFKDYSANEIVEEMHKEEAYMETERNKFISYDYAEKITF